MKMLNAVWKDAKFECPVIKKRINLNIWVLKDAKY